MTAETPGRIEGDGAGAAALEAAVQARGRELLAQVRPERLITLSPAWLQEQLMQWATSDPDFRVKLLRFVDVLPTLRTPAAVADHVRQYFRGDTPLPMRASARVAGAAPFRPVLSRVVRQGVFAMAGRFIAGATPTEALPRLRELLETGTGYTIDLLGEATLSEAEADTYYARYLDLIEAVAGLGGEGLTLGPNISVKLSALTSHFQPAAPEATSTRVRERLVPLLRAARERGVFVNIDLEQYRFKELTHRIYEDVLLSEEFRDWAESGIVVQAYLRDAAEDIEWLRKLAERRGTPITVRLVKGAYWDEEVFVARQAKHPVPVFEEKWETDANYETCSDLLVQAHPHLRPAFGTHNPRSIAQAMARAETRGLPQDAIEFQMLYGMAEGLRKAVQERGFRTRVYVPAGEIIPGMAYLVRRLLENTSNQSWLLHRHEEGDPETLLAPPRGSATSRDGREDGFQNFPVAEFHKADDREAMALALEAVRSEFGREYPALIGGERFGGGGWEVVTCPASPETVIGQVARITSEDVQRAVAVARDGFAPWRDLGAHERAQRLRRAADLIAERRWEFAATMVYESGKPWREADGDVAEAVDYLRYYAAEAERLAEGQRLTQPPGETNRYIYEPRGVAAVIAPWNFPLAIITGMASAALAAGCSVILKPAEQSPIVAAKLAKTLLEAGVPGSALQYLPGAGETGAALVEHPDVDVVAFTGSNAVGLEILRAAAAVHPGQRNVKKVVLEMGGKNAIIVDDDADLDQAVAEVAASAFGYAGQKCSACSRVIVVGSAYEEFRERLAARVEGLIAGPPEDPATELPPVISAEAKERIMSYVLLGLDEARLVAQSAPVELAGHHVPAHLFEQVAPDSRLAREEIFGPVLTLFRAKSFAEALELAMDSPFALTGGVFSRNPAHIARAAREFRVGNLYINRRITGAIVGRQPFGGMAMSGAGDKAGGPDYLGQFMVPRVITENTVRRGFAPDEGT